MDALSTTSRSKHARRRANRRSRRDMAMALNEVYELWTPGVVSADAGVLPRNRWDRKVRQLYHSVCDTEGKEAAAVFMRSLVFRADEPARHPDFFGDLIGSARQLGVPILFAVKLPLTPRRGGRRTVVTHKVSEVREVTNKSPRDGVGQLAPVRGGRRALKARRADQLGSSNGSSPQMMSWMTLRNSCGTTIRFRRRSRLTR